jgi:hypothetical protein
MEDTTNNSLQRDKNEQAVPLAKATPPAVQGHKNTQSNTGVNVGRTARQTPDRGDTYGPPELCTWSVGAGSCRFQTNQPCIARKLSQRSRAELVAYSVHASYLRVFQEKISPRSARKLVNRYLGRNGRARESASQAITPTNARFLGRKGAQNRRTSPGGLREERHSNEAMEAG